MTKFARLARLAWALCAQTIQERFAGSILGGTWVIIWPLVQLLIYIVIFGQIMGRRLGAEGEMYSYGIYLAAGLLSWTCFSNTLQKTSRCLVEKRHIIGKVPVDLRTFPLAINMEELLPFAAGFCLLFIADLFSGWTPRIFYLLLLIVALYLQQVLATGIGLIFACFSVFSRDIMEMASIGLQMAFWFTPVVYLPVILPQWLREILWINPMTCVTGIFQKCFVLGGEVSWPVFLYAAVFAHVTLIVGLYLLGLWKKDILDEL